jgi:hypothetical protein
VYNASQPVELRFEDGSFAFLRSAGDGESLEVEARPWVDVFPVGDPETDAYVATSGKQEADDVTADEPYQSAVGVEVHLRPLWTSTKLTGVDFVGPSGGFSVRVEFDEVETYPVSASA